MEKINVAELLKDCPKGMELDCALYENLEFDHIDEYNEYFPIICRAKTGLGSFNVHTFTEYGCYSTVNYAKCVIYPKGKTTWDGFHRPFKDGDVLSYQYKGFENRTIYIYMNHSKMNTTYYVALSGSSDSEFMINNQEGHALNGYNDTVRHATEEEKEKLFQAIKDNGYKWNAESKTLEKVVTDKFDITTLVPFESKVLVRDDETEKWSPAIWGFYDASTDLPYIVVGVVEFKMGIPYKENEHLLGTTNDCDDFYKTW